MATAKIGYRGNAIGISAGLGIALPLAAYAATLPFDGVNEVVRADAMPFAAGILAGVGMLTLTGHLIDRHNDRVAAEEAEAAQFTSIFSDVDAVVPRSAGSQRAAQTAQAKAEPARGKRFNRGARNAGVPVIARGVDALDEIEAWAEIDSMLSDDSPFSCDPARSKDMYQIALEELMRSDRSAAAAGAANAAASAGQTSAFFRAMGASMPVAASAAPAPAPAVSFAPAQTAQAAQAETPEQREASQDRDAAMAALYGSKVAERAHTPVLPTMSAPAPAVAAKTQPAVAADEFCPVADYSGHENMWASALAILAEEASAPAKPVPAAMPTAGQQPAAVSGTTHMDPARMAAIAEGGHATRMHSHVNAMLEEEIEKVPSKSVHRTAHEYLKVIEGGTASMPMLEAAEA